jgi:membrane protein involved in colicin uptake
LESIAKSNEEKAKAEAEAKAKAEATEKARQESKSVATRVKEKIAEMDKAGVKDENVTLKTLDPAVQSPAKWAFINFGDGKGNVELSKEEFTEYAKRYKPAAK